MTRNGTYGTTELLQDIAAQTQVIEPPPVFVVASVWTPISTYSSWDPPVDSAWICSVLTLFKSHTFFCSSLKTVCCFFGQQGFTPNALNVRGR